MDKKYEFNQALASLIEMAAANNNTLTTQQISETMTEILEDDAMLEHVFAYLVENKIHIKGYVASLKPETVEETKPEETNTLKEYKESATEQAFIDMYLTELDDIMPATEEELEALIFSATRGEVASKDKLVELYLHHVIDVLVPYKGKGVPTSDLIQEGNLGLIQGVDSYNGAPEEASFRKHLTTCIEQALQASLDEEIGAKRIGSHLADRANTLDRISTEFAKENGREPSIAELSKAMGLPEDEIHNILKYSLDALNSTGEE